MDRQAVFDTVVRHLLQQGRPAVEPAGAEYGGLVCRYRAADGCRCAIGWLLRDADYVPWMEGEDVHAVIDAGALAYLEIKDSDDRENPLDSDRNFLVALQRAHDDSASSIGRECAAPAWAAVIRLRLAAVAMKYGLSKAALDEGGPGHG